MNTEIIIEKEKKQVIKICNSTKEFKKELYIYKKNLPFTPKLLDHNRRNMLVLEEIDGSRIGDLIYPDFSKLATLFFQLHSLERKNDHCICHIDNNPKNYLCDIKNHKYYMIDFSSWEFDYPETDLIHFLLFWASIFDHSTFTKAFEQFKNSYQACYAINPIQWEILLPDLIEKFDLRREKFGKYEYNPDTKKNRNLMKKIV